ncbi:Protein CBG23889 [Caenorhabditis briggsae]|uniref:Protein CBG23889 n=1 Tax=Caenorhabditis briggsae TaxID=6238 RepID=A8WJI6_CAEBR|nr:Protein CBG23889 [Caenorhabditis briggsae]CAP20628.1 Protein CBG23889 [Caenorhabditis briggsae]
MSGCPDLFPGSLLWSPEKRELILLSNSLFLYSILPEVNGTSGGSLESSLRQPAQKYNCESRSGETATIVFLAKIGDFTTKRRKDINSMMDYKTCEAIRNRHPIAKPTTTRAVPMISRTDHRFMRSRMDHRFNNKCCFSCYIS